MEPEVAGAEDEQEVDAAFLGGSGSHPGTDGGADQMLPILEDLVQSIADHRLRIPGYTMESPVTLCLCPLSLYTI